MRRFCGPIFIIFSLIQQAELLHCYVCTSAEIKGCGNPFDFKAMKGELAYCDPVRNHGEEYFCVQEIYSFSYYATDEGLHPDLYIRKCRTDVNDNMSPGSCPKFSVHDVDHNVTYVKCELCQKDGCNRAGRNTKSWVKNLIYVGLLYLVNK